MVVYYFLYDFWDWAVLSLWFLRLGYCREQIRSKMRMLHDNTYSHMHCSYRYVLTTQLNNLASLAKCLNVHLRTKWLWVWILLQSLISFEQEVPQHSGNYRLWIHSLKHVRYMIITYSQMHHTDKFLQHSSISWPVWLNGWVFVYDLSGCGFQSCCSDIGLKFLGFVLVTFLYRF